MVLLIPTYMTSLVTTLVSEALLYLRKGHATHTGVAFSCAHVSKV